jgi:hypothetical protein
MDKLAAASPMSRMPDSPTPTHRRPKRRNSLPDRPPRPLNCFMVYRKAMKHEVLRCFPNVDNRDISRIVAFWWRMEPASVKDEWKRRAEEAKVEHQRMYPGYKYQPRKKQRPVDGLRPSSSSGVLETRKFVPLAPKARTLSVSVSPLVSSPMEDAANNPFFITSNPPMDMAATATPPDANWQETLAEHERINAAYWAKLESQFGWMDVMDWNTASQTATPVLGAQADLDLLPVDADDAAWLDHALQDLIKAQADDPYSWTTQDVSADHAFTHDEEVVGGVNPRDVWNPLY